MNKNTKLVIVGASRTVFLDHGFVYWGVKDLPTRREVTWESNCGCCLVQPLSGQVRRSIAELIFEHVKSQVRH